MYAASLSPEIKAQFDYLTISLIPLIASGTAAAIGIACVVWMPPRRFVAPLLLLIYTAVITSIGALILENGGVQHSPYLFLWSIASVVAFALGAGAAMMVAGGTCIYLMWQSLQHQLGLLDVVILSISTFFPLVISYTLWGHHTPTGKEIDPEERNYHELASELRQVAGKSEVVINAIDDGVIALDSQGLVELINPAAQRMIGWGKHDALGLNYKSVLKLVDTRNQDMTDANDPIAKTLATNQSTVDESLSLVTSAGKHMILSIVATPVGQLGAGVIVVFRNVTQAKAEEREQAEFISTASHEMRTPVASIEGYLGLALNPATATIDDKARDFIGKAHAAAQHLGHLFQDLLDVTKADDGRIVSNPQVIDLIPLVSEVVEGFAPQATDKQLHLIFNPTSGVRSAGNVNPIYYIDVDVSHFREVISNLVENAIKYTAEGEVVVDIEGDDSHVTISVRDTGIGIPKEDQSHLFQKFYRVDNSDTRTIGGTGLGLYLCRKLTESMSGRIWVESEYRKGSTFYLDFPRLSQEEAMRRIDAAAINAAVLPATHMQATPATQPTTTTTALPPAQPATQPIAATPVAVAPAAPITAPTPTATTTPIPQPIAPAQPVVAVSPAATPVVAAQPIAATPPQPVAAPLSTVTPAAPTTQAATRPAPALVTDRQALP